MESVVEGEEDTSQEEEGSEVCDSMDEEGVGKGWRNRTKAGQEKELNELEATMEKLRQGKGKVQYHTKKDLPTKEEAMENFRLGVIDKAYEAKWRQK